MWGKLSWPFPIFNGEAIEVWELTSNFISHFTAVWAWDYLSMLGLKLIHVSERYDLYGIGTSGVDIHRPCLLVPNIDSWYVCVGFGLNVIEWNVPEIGSTSSVPYEDFGARSRYIGNL